MLPNPHSDDSLPTLTGKDAPVAEFLKSQKPVQYMFERFEGFLEQWLPSLAQDHRSYVTVAIGCTGGQHRSVYLVECLSQRFSTQWATLTRHRELDARSIP
jgi:UPF0042 nucleotide-binding protein